MRLRKYSLSNLMLYGIIAICMLLITRLSFVGGNEINIYEASVHAGLILLLSFLYFFIEHKNHTLKVRIPLLVCLLGLFASNIVATILVPNSIELVLPIEEGATQTFATQITNVNKIVSIFSYGAFLYSFYLIVGVVPQKIHSLRQLNLFFYSLVILAFVAAIYSFVVDSQGYIDLFNGLETGRSYIISFTNNANNYAAILFFGIVGSLFLHHTTNKVWFYFPAAFFFIVSAFTLSRTYIISSFIFLVGYLIVRGITEFKQHKLKVILSIVVGALVLVALIVPYVYCANNNLVEKFPPFVIVKLFFDRFTNGLSGREIVWQQSFDTIVKTNSWIMGMGFGLFDTIFYGLQASVYGSSAVGSPHNGIIQILANGGVILAGFAAILIIYLIVMSTRIYKEHKRLVWVTLVIFLAFGFQMIFEAPSPFSPGLPVMNYCFMAVIFFVPILSMAYVKKYEISKKTVLAPNKEGKYAKNGRLIISQTIAFLTMLAIVIIAGIMMPLYPSNEILKITVCILLVLFFLVPFIIYGLVNSKFSFKQYFVSLFIPYIIVGAILTSGAHAIIYFVSNSALVIFELEIALPILFFLSFMVVPCLRRSSGVFGSIVYFISKLSYSHFYKEVKKVEEKEVVSDDEYYNGLIRGLKMFKKKRHV